MKTFKSYRVLNAALGEVSGDAFRVLWFIVGNLSQHKVTRNEISRISIAVRLKMCDDDDTPRKIKRVLDKITLYTNELEDKGFIKKDEIYDRNTGKRKTFYAIAESFLEEKVTNDGQKTGQNLPSDGQKLTKTDQKRGVSKQYNKITDKQYNNTTEEQYNSSNVVDKSFAEVAVVDLDNLPF